MPSKKLSSSADDFDIDSLIEYFEHRLQQLQFIHQNKENQKVNSSTVLISSSNMILTLFVIILTVLMSIVSSNIATTSQLYVSDYSNLISLASQPKTNLTMLLLNTTSQQMENNAQGFKNAVDGIKYLGYLLIIVLILFVICILSISLNNRKHDSQLDKNAENLGEISMILLILYKIKLEWKNKFELPEVRTKLLLIEYPFKRYREELERLVYSFKKRD